MTTFTVKSGRLPTPEELVAHEQLKAQQANQLPAVRQAAERWRNGAGLSGGAIAIASLLVAPDILKEASPTQTLQGGIALGIAFVIAVIAIGLSLRASIGWPTFVTISSLMRLREWERAELERSISCLRWSMGLTVAALVATGLAGAILLFGLEFCWPVP